MTPLLSTRSLVFSYDNEKQLAFPDLSINEGEKLLITGSSGSGKTTLIRLLSGLMKPQTGEVTFLGQSFSQLGRRDSDQLRGQNIGMVRQEMIFAQSLRCLDNLLLAPYCAGIKPDKHVAKTHLEKMGIGYIAQKFPTQISTGERQRLGICRALMNNPKLLIADEPTSNLDDQNAMNIIKILTDLSDIFNSGLIVVTHDSRIKESFNRIYSI